MGKKIQIGIVGYGNLGQSVERVVNQWEDLELFGIFTRRNPKDLITKNSVYSYNTVIKYKDDIDVLILCGGSKSDIPEQGPHLLSNFNTVDVYDNHRKLFNYYQQMDHIGKKSEKSSIIAAGWDPGLFSWIRLLHESIQAEGKTYTFWGTGVSQGHSDALRRIDGVQWAVQYTVPKEDLMDQVRHKKTMNIDRIRGHKRICYIVLEEGANFQKIQEEIRNMEDYFKGYDVEIHEISKEEYLKNHQGLNHGGYVFRQGITGINHSLMEYHLDLDSNPDFTASVALASARACYQLYQKGKYGAHTVFEVPTIYFYPGSLEEAIEKYL
ncbi:MAG: diaminopimelate dehydrogenase [Tissierellia bacterium]|nr:diaminopimelate dehydrogenase [Tissierellia bacterium]